MEVNDKVVIVTGGAQGIGKAIALLMSKSGGKIVIADINIATAEATAQEIEELGKEALAVEADISLLSEAEKVVNAAVEQFGTVDILVNNAGITRDNLFLKMKEAEWDAVMAINLKSVFNCSKAVIRTMSKQRSGKIINIASVVGQMGNVGQANYAASKAGIIALTKTLALEFGTRGINVNAVAPGFIESEMTKSLPEKVRENFLNRIPFGRMGTPEEIADAVLFLASDASRYITGQVINVNGGIYM